MGEGGKKKTAELGGRDQECRFSLSVRSAGEVRESHAVIRVQCRGGIPGKESGCAKALR